MAGSTRTIYLGLVVVAVVVLAFILVAGRGGGAPTTTTATVSPTTASTTTPTTEAATETATPTTTPAGTATRTETPPETTTGTATQTATAPPATQTSTSKPTCKEKVKLIVLTRHPADIQERARDAFLESSIAKQYCVEDVTFIAIPPGFWAQRIKSSKIDVGWGGGPTLFDNLYLAGLLHPLETKLALDAASQVPDTFAGMPMKRVSEDGKIYWVAAAIASFGFTVNTEVAQQLGFDVSKLKSWRDLASDDLGLILLRYGIPALAIANPLQSTSNTRMYEIILQAYGWEEGWRVLTLMAANARIEEGSAIVRDDVINGDVMVGITIDFYGYTAERLNPACRYVLPQGETIVNGDPIAVTASTGNPEAAEAFLAWVLTEGQAIWLSPSINRLPANPKVFDMPVDKLAKIAGVDPKTMEKQVKLLKAKYEEASKAKVFKFNDTLALETEYPMQLYFVATLVDEHDLLQEAWTKLLKAYYVDKSISKEKFEELKKRLGEPVEYRDPVTGKTVKFTLEDAIRVNKLIKEAMAKGNSKLKDEYMNAWRAAARAKYEAILRELGG